MTVPYCICKCFDMRIPQYACVFFPYMGDTNFYSELCVNASSIDTKTVKGHPTETKDFENTMKTLIFAKSLEKLYFAEILYDKSRSFKLLKNRTVQHGSSKEIYFTEQRISKTQKFIFL